MKVIFLQDVPKVAKAGQMKEVATGYGRNYLIPKKLATPVTPAAIEAVEAELKKRAKEQAQLDTEMGELAGLIDGKEITIKAQAGSKEKLYGSVTAADIAAEIENALGAAIDKRKVELDKPIQEIGSYQVTVRLTKGVTPGVTVNVIGVGEKKAEAEVAKAEVVEEETEAEVVEEEAEKEAQEGG